MSAINSSKVVVGGLLAGVVFNVLDFISNAFIMNADFVANAMRLGLDPAAMETTGNMMTWIVVDFLLGFVAVFTYAAIRPRFGPGAKTAAIAGVLIYLPITLVMYGMAYSGMMTMGMWTKMAVIQLVVAIVGTTAGAWAYKEG